MYTSYTPIRSWTNNAYNAACAAFEVIVIATIYIVYLCNFLKKTK